MNNFILGFLDLFKRLYQLSGVNYDQLRTIVSIKLITDNRRHIVAFKRKKENEEPSNTFGVTLIMYTLFGIFPSIFIFTIHSLIVSMIFFFSYIMVMIAMTLITDFSSILLDTSDNTIILPRPVDGRTLFMARLTHIMIYLGTLTFSLSFFPIVAVMFKYGFLFSLAFFIALILSVLTALMITNIVYLLIMQFASEEKLKSVINYFQIIMAVAFMGGYQLLPRMMGRFELSDYVFEISWWGYFIPSIWMGGALELLKYHVADSSHLILLTLAFTFPMAGLYITNRYLTPLFNKKIGELGISNAVVEVVGDKVKSGSTLNERIGGIITNNLLERAAFDLVFKMLGRDRKIKLKIYPAMGYILVFGLVFMLKGREDLSTTWHNLHNTKYYLVLIYFTFMISQVALREVPYSDDFKASWFYSSAPIARPGEILSGMLKAIFVRLFLPVYTIISLFLVYVWGIPVLLDISVGLFNNILILLIMALVGNRILPLSTEPNARQQSGNLVRGIIMMLCMAIPGGIHYVLGYWPLAMLGFMPIQLIATYFMVRAYKATTWAKIVV